MDGHGTTPEAGARDAVTLSTIHAAKGLEFDYVFVTGVEEGLLPHYLSTESAEQVEEERRLLYVAMTRGRHRVFLTPSTERSRWGKVLPVEASRFLEDLR